MLTVKRELQHNKIYSGQRKERSTEELTSSLKGWRPEIVWRREGRELKAEEKRGMKLRVQ